MGFYIPQLGLIGGYELLKSLLVAAHCLAFLLPVAFVSCNLPQVAVEVDIPLSRPCSSVCKYLFRQPDLVCYLEGERASRLSLIKAEEWLHQLVIKSHGSVTDALL